MGDLSKASNLADIYGCMRQHKFGKVVMIVSNNHELGELFKIFVERFGQIFGLSKELKRQLSAGEEGNNFFSALEKVLQKNYQDPSLKAALNDEKAYLKLKLDDSGNLLCYGPDFEVNVFVTEFGNYASHNYAHLPPEVYNHQTVYEDNSIYPEKIFSMDYSLDFEDLDDPDFVEDWFLGRDGMDRKRTARTKKRNRKSAGKSKDAKNPLWW
jgi:hypothetical protein